MASMKEQKKKKKREINFSKYKIKTFRVFNYLK